MSCKRILSVSRDMALLSTRAAMLEQRGYEVISILGNATEYCKRGGFDLFLVENSIADAGVDDMIAAWRQRSDAPIVWMVGSFCCVRDGMDRYVDALDPDELVRTVVSVLGTEKLEKLPPPP